MQTEDAPRPIREHSRSARAPDEVGVLLRDEAGMAEAAQMPTSPSRLRSLTAAEVSATLYLSHMAQT
jgi:hypothetical protein